MLCVSTLVQSEEDVSSSTQHTQSCPENFYSLPLIPNAKYCQQFSTELPASLSYYTKSDLNTAKNFYIDKMGPAESADKLKGRIVLQYNNGSKIVIISPDGDGSQIDILVKSSN